MEIKKVYHQLKTGSGVEFTTSDLVWIDGVPTVVLKWKSFNSGSGVPEVVIPLDPACLHPLTGWPDATYMYEWALEDPRAGQL